MRWFAIGPRRSFSVPPALQGSVESRAMMPTFAVRSLEKVVEECRRRGFTITDPLHVKGTEPDLLAEVP